MKIFEIDSCEIITVKTNLPYDCFTILFFSRKKWFMDAYQYGQWRFCIDSQMSKIFFL